MNLNLENLGVNADIKIIDAFTFYNELDMLDFRLAELNETVDYFVLVEATHTHAGANKPLFFQLNKPRYEKYLDKIIHVVVDDFPETNDPWIREKYQRNCIMTGLNSLKLNQLDIVTVTDVDEIPDPSSLLQLKKSGFNGVLCLKQDFYYYNLNNLFNYKWYHGKVCTYNKLLKFGGPDQVRFLLSASLNNGGWHFSYFGSPGFISNKIKNFAHQEFNEDKFTNEESIIDKIQNSKDLFGRELNLTKQEITSSTYLPKNWKMLERIK